MLERGVEGTDPEGWIWGGFSVQIENIAVLGGFLGEKPKEKLLMPGKFPAPGAQRGKTGKVPSGEQCPKNSSAAEV